MYFKMKYLYFFLQIIFLLFFHTGFTQISVKRDTVLMGSKFDITIVDDDSISAQKNINLVIAEITRIEDLISEWKPTSQVYEINRNAGIKPVKVDQELFDLTKRALFFSEITNGAFDISIAAMDKIWRFDDSMEELPSDDAIKKSIEKVNYQDIVLNKEEQTIFLKNKGMKIGFGATGKGYAADRGKWLMQKLNVKSGIVNASGDLTTWGKQPDESLWRIGITNPFKPNKSLYILQVSEAAITTSGDYQKYVEFNNIRYSHIINPKTGMPAAGLVSATVIGPNAETANGFSTSIIILGEKEGFKLLKNYPDYACLVLTDKGKIKKTKNFKSVLKKLRAQTTSATTKVLPPM